MTALVLFLIGIGLIVVGTEAHVFAVLVVGLVWMFLTLVLISIGLDE